MMVKKYFIVIHVLLLLIILPLGVKAQQGSPYSQYVFNKYLLNPGAAGAEGITSFNLTSRKNWIGYADGPGIVSLTAQTRIIKSPKFMKSLSMKRKTARRRRPSGRIGLGAQVFTDFNARFSKTGLRATYSYHLPVYNAQLSFGLSATVYQDKVNLNNMILYDPVDDIINNLDRNKITMNGDLGVFYTNFQYYAGYSMLNLYRRSVGYSIGENILNADRVHLLMGGYRYEFNRDFELEGNGLFRLPEKGGMEGEINIKALYMREYWAGISYRTTKSVVFNVGGGYKNFFLGYAFDLDFNDISRIARFGGTHEFIVGYNIGDKKKRYKWLNRF